jgi:hypothetical protein
MIKKGSNELPPPNDDWGTAANKLWSEVTALYALRPDDLRLLEDACNEADLIAEFEEIRPGPKDFLTRGSHGQLMPHPVLRELASHRRLFA